MKIFSAFAVPALAVALLPALVTSSGGQRKWVHTTADDAAPGQLTIVQKSGKTAGLCPLKGTKVDVDIAGFGARVTLIQTFTNPTKMPIEAIYTFPLPADSAVDRMRMKVGNRVISGNIKKRDEARKIFEEARNQGRVASLLDQERPNIFTQSVTNIMPGAEVQIEISYAQILKYEKGEFEFMYPMVVGPRYVNESTHDPSKISPPITPKGTRTGANIELNVRLNAGADLQSIESELHKIDVMSPDNSEAKPSRKITSRNLQNVGIRRLNVQLSNLDEIPNRDFILRYGVATNQVTSSFTTFGDASRGGFFSLILMPPKAPSTSQVLPKEIIFVVDQSGSQRGFPIEKSIELSKKLIENLNPSDTFNVLGFSNIVNQLWRSSQPNSPRTRAEAIGFLEQLQANGGTELEKAIIAALEPPFDPKRSRIVVFNTDGFAGSEPSILNAIRKYHQNSRVFTFGIGNSVNRYLVDSMSQEGKGDSEIVTLAADSDKSVAKFYQRINNPILTNVIVEFDGVEVSDVNPKLIPDVFSEKPVIVFGRFTKNGNGSVRISGTNADGGWTDEIPVTFTMSSTSGSSLPSLWARNRIKEIETDAYINGALNNQARNAPAEEITKVALDFGLMSAYTSFVAVEEKVINKNGIPTTVEVPVEMADGVANLESDNDEAGRPAARRGNAIGGGGGFGGGSGGPGGSPGAASISLGAPAQSPATTKGKMTTAIRDEKNRGGEGKTPSLSEEAQKKQNYEQKISDALRKINSGRVKIQIWLSAMDAKTLDAIAKCGFKITERGVSQPVVFAFGDATNLNRLAQIPVVVRVKQYK